MKRSSYRGFLVVLVLIAVISAVGLVGGKWMQRRSLQQQVYAALQNDDRMARMQLLARLRDEHASDARDIVIAALDDPSEMIRGRAGSALSLFHDHVADRADALISHLRNSPDPNVRLSCAILLMSVKTRAVRAAYRQALHDPSDKVVQIACGEVAERGGADAPQALYPVLEHPAWHVRLEACKAFISLKAADARVVSTLEQMRQEPEAAKYDAFEEEIERREKEINSPPELRARWGKLDTILEQARQIAAARR